MQIIEFQIDSSLPVLKSNFALIKTQLAENLKTYEIEVNARNLPDAKKMATELNKISKQIDDLKREKLKEIEAPIDVFKDQVKELIEMCQDGRSRILDQVRLFEDNTRAKYLELLKVELQEQYSKLKLQDEFRNVVIDDLALISNITDSGNLTKSARDSVGERVYASSSLQNLVEKRLVELENTSLKTGLKSPLERRHVESFLKTDDFNYNLQLQKLLENEIRRQKEIEERIIAEQEKEQKRREAQIRAEKERKHKAELERVKKEQIERQKLESTEKPNSSENPISPVAKEYLDATPGTDIFIITVTFKIEIPSEKMATSEVVESKFRKTLSDRGFESVQSVDVSKLENLKV